MDLNESSPRMRSLHALLIVAFLCGATDGTATLRADEPIAEKPTAVEQPVETASSVEDPDPAEKKAQAARQEKVKETIEIGFVLLGGIGILGVFLIAFALIYGRRLRRQVQAGRSPSQVRDELWYLKAKPPAQNLEDTDA